MYYQITYLIGFILGISFLLLLNIALIALIRFLNRH